MRSTPPSSRAVAGVVAVSLALLSCEQRGENAASHSPAPGSELKQPAATTTATQPAQPAGFVRVVVGAPRSAAASARAVAAGRAALAAGALPQPMVEVEGARSPMMNSNGWAVGVGQDFPRWGERRSARSMAAADAAMANADAWAAAGEVASMAASMLVEGAAADSRAEVQRAMAERAKVLLTSVAASVAGGDQGLPELLGLQTRQESAELMEKDARREAADARGTARSLLGLAADAALPPVEMPTDQDLDPEGGAMVAVARAKRALANAQEADAQSLGAPMIGLEARIERMPDDPQDTMYSLGVRMTMPVQRSPTDRGVEAARLRARASVLDEQGERLRARELAARAARARAQRDAVHTFADAAIKRLDLELRSFTTRVGAGEAGAFAQLLDRFDRLSEIRLTVVEADLAAEKAQADLWTVVRRDRLGGTP